MNLTDIREFQPVSIDTRTLQPGDLFVALVGDNFDGHKFVKIAEAQGACAAVVEKDVNCDIPLIKVPNTFYAFGELAAMRRQQVDIPIIALTGSCGKTTTKTMLASILSLCGKTLATEKNLNNNVGVPLTLLKLMPEHQYAVIEAGANQPDEIEYAAKIIRPDIAIITNVAPVHLEGFGSIDNVANIKADLLRFLKDDGTAVLNADDHYYDYWRNIVVGKEVLKFGIEKSADIMAYDLKLDSQGLPSFTLQTPTANTEVILPVFGLHNVMNALAAAAAAYKLDIDIETIKQGLETMQPVAGRLIKKTGKKSSIILDDSYNANPRSMLMSMQVLIAYPGKKILVVGDMAELGKDAERYHYELGATAKELGIDLMYAVGELTPIAIEAFGSGGYHFGDREELKAALQEQQHADVVFLVKGSKINRMWEMVEALQQ